MRVELHFGSAVTFDVKWDEKQRVLSIEPLIMPRRTRNLDLCGVRVVGASGRQTSSLAVLNTDAGTVGVLGAAKRNVEAGFDMDIATAQPVKLTIPEPANSITSAPLGEATVE